MSRFALKLPICESPKVIAQWHVARKSVLCLKGQSKRATSDTKHQLPVFQVYVRVVDDMVVDKFTQSGWSHSLARRKELLSFVLENRLGIPHIKYIYNIYII